MVNSFNPALEFITQAHDEHVNHGKEEAWNIIQSFVNSSPCQRARRLPRKEVGKVEEVSSFVPAAFSQILILKPETCVLLNQRTGSNNSTCTYWQTLKETVHTKIKLIHTSGFFMQNIGHRDVCKRIRVPRQTRYYLLLLLSWVNGSGFIDKHIVVDFLPYSPIILEQRQTSLRPLALKRGNLDQSNPCWWIAIQARGKFWIVTIGLNCFYLSDAFWEGGWGWKN